MTIRRRLADEREHLSLLLERTLVDLRAGHFRTLAEFVSREHEAREKLRVVRGVGGPGESS